MRNDLKPLEFPFLVRLFLFFPAMILVSIFLCIGSIFSSRFVGLLGRELSNKILRTKELGLEKKNFYENSLPNTYFLCDFVVGQKQYKKGQQYPAYEYSYNMLMELLTTGVIVLGD